MIRTTSTLLPAGTSAPGSRSARPAAARLRRPAAVAAAPVVFAASGGARSVRAARGMEPAPWPVVDLGRKPFGTPNQRTTLGIHFPGRPSS